MQMNNSEVLKLVNFIWVMGFTKNSGGFDGENWRKGCLREEQGNL